MPYKINDYLTEDLNYPLVFSQLTTYCDFRLQTKKLIETTHSPSSQGTDKMMSLLAFSLLYSIKKNDICLTACVPALFCSYHILMLSVIYYRTDAGPHRIYIY